MGSSGWEGPLVGWEESTAAGDSYLNGGTSEEQWEEGDPLKRNDVMGSLNGYT